MAKTFAVIYDSTLYANVSLRKIDVHPTYVDIIFENPLDRVELSIKVVDEVAVNVLDLNIHRRQDLALYLYEAIIDTIENRGHTSINDRWLDDLVQIGANVIRTRYEKETE